MVEQQIWGMDESGKAVILYTITNSRGEWVKILNLGASIAGIGVLDKNGNIDDVVLGYKEWRSYFCDGAAFGKSVGRYANRICKGLFTLDGVQYKLAINNGPNHLHGGPMGFQNRIWDSSVEGDAVIMEYFSADGEEGYPGNLSVMARFDWDDNANLEITYTARTDRTTIVNLTNHVYFNLKGDGKGDILDHSLKLNCSSYLPTDDTSIPYGNLEQVAGTPMDFTEPHLIGERIAEPFQQLIWGKGYDHCWVIDNWSSGNICQAAELSESTTGRKVTVRTTQPGIQIYTGNWLEGAPEGKRATYHDRSGVAMECQSFPDTPNKPQFPSCVLTPDSLYEQHIVYSFSAN